MTKLLKDGKVIADDWVHVADEEDLPARGGVIVSLARWKADHNSLAGRADGIGVRLEAGQSPEEIKDDLSHFAVIALDLPKFGDGRAYSYARLLKGRLQFEGEVRAVGDVLRDQFRAMYRCGFDALEVSEDADDEALERSWQEALGEFRYAYQPAYRGQQTVLKRRHPAAAA